MSEEEKRKIIDGLRYCSDENNICGKDCPAYKKDGGCRDDLMKRAARALAEPNNSAADAGKGENGCL